MSQTSAQRRTNHINIRPNFLNTLASLGAMSILLASCLKKQDSTALVQSETMPEAPQQEMTELIDTALEQLNDVMLDSDFNEPLDAASGQAAVNTLQKSSTTAKAQLQTLLKKVNTKWVSLGRNPCTILVPIEKKFGKSAIQPYFFMGGSVEAGVGLHGMVGTDYVWDLYNLQMAVFNYKSIETVFGAGSVGAGANAYLGLGFGKKANVVDAWSGRFAAVGIAGSLPLLANYFSGHISHFTGQTPRGKPDYSIQGGSIGVSATMSLPSAAPGALQVSAGHWTVNKAENIKLARLFKRLGINHATTGIETCQGSCLRFDNIAKSAGYTGRAVNLAKSLPLLMLSSSVGALPLSLDKVMLLALATGAYRDTRNRAEACKH